MSGLRVLARTRSLYGADDQLDSRCSYRGREHVPRAQCHGGQSAPLYLAAHGASATEIGIVAGIYPAVWGAGQLLTGWLSDYTGRKPLITTGMLVQAGALTLLVAGGGTFASALVAAVFLGVGTALVYPTLIAAVSDGVQPVERAQVLGVYRFWRDFGFVAGALLAGLVADAAGADTAIVIVAALTAGSGLWVGLTRWTERDRTADRRAGRRNVDDLLADARRRIEPRFQPEQAHEAQVAGALHHRPPLERRAPPGRSHSRFDPHSEIGSRVAGRS